jgi:putative endonuclease
VNNKKISNTQIGQIGEDLACDFILKQGYVILERNWRYKKAEIDIVCKKDEILVFIEVKCKSSSYFGEPEDAVDEAKEALLIDAAQRYMDKIAYNWEIRFDIISIVLDAQKRIRTLKHFEDAFFN